MRQLRRDDAGASWLLTPGERELLLALFSRPEGPRSPACLSRTSEDLDARARAELAGELEGHRDHVRTRLEALFRAMHEVPASPAAEPGAESPGAPSEPGWILRLTPDDRECLLQALNERRLGAWESLGRPDPPEIPDSLSPASPDFLDWWTLVIASRFQGCILSGEFQE
ncbi:MAG: hypothetical protein ACKOKG_01200 [Verrucomicrobiota bacterium]|jgi:hypothetical protein